MSCPTAHTLFEYYSSTTIEYFDATGELTKLTGRY
jgi:hypothetical protein